MKKLVQTTGSVKLQLIANGGKVKTEFPEVRNMEAYFVRQPLIARQPWELWGRKRNKELLFLFHVTRKVALKLLKAKAA